MSVRKPILAPVVAGLIAVGVVSQATAQSEVPPFIEVGKSYVIVSLLLAFGGGSLVASAEVVEIGPGPWIKVRMSESDFPAPHMWVNMNAVDAVFEITPEIAAFNTGFVSTRDKAYQAAMKSDLRNLATAQEAYFFDNTTYASLESLGRMFTPTTGVTIEINTFSATAWSATARHENSVAVCAIFMGNAPPPMDEMREGEPTCR